MNLLEHDCIFNLDVSILPWPSSASEAVEIQKSLAKQLVLKGNLDAIDLVAGIDASSHGKVGPMTAAVVVRSLHRDCIVAEATATVDVNFPYIPGLLAFRELPAFLAAFDKLDVKPEAVICDGQGIAHPRGIGIASHLGLYLNIPTLGCAKSRLIGKYTEPGLEKGSRTDLVSGDMLIGTVVRTRTAVKPVFVSPGHLCDIDSAAGLVLRSCSRYRLPEPIRNAHNLAGSVQNNYMRL